MGQDANGNIRSISDAYSNDAVMNGPWKLHSLGEEGATPPEGVHVTVTCDQSSSWWRTRPAAATETWYYDGPEETFDEWFTWKFGIPDVHHTQDANGNITMADWNDVSDQNPWKRPHGICKS